MAEVIRSKKFQLYSDEKILSCYLDKPRGENLHFLQVEINERGLESELHCRQAIHSKKSRHSPPILCVLPINFMSFFRSIL